MQIKGDILISTIVNPFTPLGDIEPHGELLAMPDQNQDLYKVMSIENFLQSVKGNYLHFNRVDSYSDFPDSDNEDGQLLPNDRVVCEDIKFKSDPGFSVADYYDSCRARTYACCFSLDFSKYTGKGMIHPDRKIFA